MTMAPLTPLVLECSDFDFDQSLSQDRALHQQRRHWTHHLGMLTGFEQSVRQGFMPNDLPAVYMPLLEVAEILKMK